MLKDRIQDPPHGGRGSIVDLVVEASASIWEVPAVCEAFESGVVVGNTWNAGTEHCPTGNNIGSLIAAMAGDVTAGGDEVLL